MDVSDSSSAAPAAVERKLVAVLVCEVDASTASGLEHALERDHPVAGHLGRVEAEVARHDGMVVETMGDMLVAVFGVPRTHDDDPERAVRTALAGRAPRPHREKPDRHRDVHRYRGAAPARPPPGPGRGRRHRPSRRSRHHLLDAAGGWAALARGGRLGNVGRQSPHGLGSRRGSRLHRLADIVVLISALCRYLTGRFGEAAVMAADARGAGRDRHDPTVQL
jgi:hypothetical protein